MKRSALPQSPFFQRIRIRLKQYVNLGRVTEKRLLHSGDCIKTIISSFSGQVLNRCRSQETEKYGAGPVASRFCLWNRPLLTCTLYFNNKTN